MTIDLTAYAGSTRTLIFQFESDASVTAEGWYLDDISIARKTPSSIEEGLMPAVTKLHGNYPNPFNPETTVSFDLSEDSNVKLNIYDMKGSLVRTLLSGGVKSGSHKVMWNGKDNGNNQLSSGIYYISLETKDNNFTHKSLMIK